MNQYEKPKLLFEHFGFVEDVITGCTPALMFENESDECRNNSNVYTPWLLYSKKQRDDFKANKYGVSVYLREKGFNLGIPINGAFELTSRCNFHCKKCCLYAQGETVDNLKKRELSTKQWIEIGKNAQEAGMLYLILTGGEPFMREDFPQIYESFIKMGFAISINTNASLFNDKLSELFAKYPPMRINVTLYGSSEKSYEQFCGVAIFEKVINNVKRMLDEGLPVRLTVPLTKPNYEGIEKISNIAYELGLFEKTKSYVNNQKCLNESAEKSNEKISVCEAEDVKMHERVIGIPQCDERERKLDSMPIQNCAAKSCFLLTWEGDMVPYGITNRKYGNIKELNFSNAWKNFCKTVSETEFLK